MVDVIIPAYNAEKKIYKALSSLAVQTNKDFIVYIVDDGSSDNTQKEIDKFSDYINIEYLKCEHLGKPGLVRNYGLDHSNSDYVMFCDSDDFFAPNAIEIISKTFNDFPDLDFLISFFYEQLQSGDFIQKNQTATTWLHGNAYKREFLYKYDIRFPSQKLNEDGAFNTQVYLFSDKFKIISLPIYYWMYDTSSLTRINSDKNNHIFTFNSFVDLVDSLNFAYNNLLHKNGYSDKVLSNMGSHLAVFYFKLCDLAYCYTTENKKYKKYYTAAVTSLSNFFNNIDKSCIFNSHEFKNGFCSQYIKRNSSSALLTLDSYFSIFGVKNYISADDFCGLLQSNIQN